MPNWITKEGAEPRYVDISKDPKAWAALQSKGWHEVNTGAFTNRNMEARRKTIARPPEPERTGVTTDDYVIDASGDSGGEMSPTASAIAQAEQEASQAAQLPERPPARKNLGLLERAGETAEAAIGGIANGLLLPGIWELAGAADDAILGAANEHLGTDFDLGRHDRARILREEHPYASYGSEILAGFHPAALLNKLARPLLGVNQAKTFGGHMARAAGEGAALGGIASAAEMVNEGLASEIEGTEDPWGHLSADRMGTSMLAGSILSPLPAAAVAAGRHSVKSLRGGLEGRGPEIRRMEEAGIETDWRSGFTEPEWLEPLTTPEGMNREIEGVSDLAHEGALRQQEQGIKLQQMREQAFAETPEGQKPLTVAPVLQVLRDVANRGTDSLAGAFRGPPHPEIQAIRQRLGDPEILRTLVDEVAMARTPAQAERARAAAAEIASKNDFVAVAPGGEVPEGAVPVTAEEIQALGLRDLVQGLIVNEPPGPVTIPDADVRSVAPSTRREGLARDTVPEGPPTRPGRPTQPDGPVTRDLSPPRTERATGAATEREPDLPYQPTLRSERDGPSVARGQREKRKVSEGDIQLTLARMRREPPNLTDDELRAMSRNERIAHDEAVDLQWFRDLLPNDQEEWVRNFYNPRELDRPGTPPSPRQIRPMTAAEREMVPLGPEPPPQAKKRPTQKFSREELEANAAQDRSADLPPAPRRVRPPPLVRPGEPPGGQPELYLVPRERSVAELEDGIQVLNQRAGFAEERNESQLAMDLREAAKALMDVRRQVGANQVAPAERGFEVPGAPPATGYAGMKKQEADEIRQRRERQAAAGLPAEDLREVPRPMVGGQPQGTRRVEMPEGQENRVGRNVAQYKRWAPSELQRHDQALRELVQAAGGDVRRLDRIAAAVAHGKMKSQVSPDIKLLGNAGGIGSYATGVKEAIRIRLDPAARGLASAKGTGGQYAGKVGAIDPIAEYVRDKVLEMLESGELREGQP